MKSPRKLELGAEPGKIAILGVLVAVAGYLVYTNLLSPGEDYTPPAKSATTTPPRPVRKAMDNVAKAEQQAGVAQPDGPAPVGANRVIPGRRAQGDFKPALKPRAGDPSRLDPALRLDLLAKLREVKLAGGGRSLFDFSSTPAAAKPKQEEPKIAVKPRRPVQGPELPPPPPPPPVKPPPPPIPLKFYGSALPVRGGVKRVFCMQNDEIFTPTEGDVIMKKYRIVRINPTGVVVEDIEYKNEQTLPIDEVPKSG